jgi:hypothetical protein
MLLRRVSRPESEVVESLVGMQAQNPNDPYVALWSRLEGFRAEELAQLMLERQVARSTLMRGTIHLVTARDCLALRPHMQPIVERNYLTGNQFGRKVKGLAVEEVKNACIELLRTKPRSRAELKRSLAERWPDQDAEAMSFALYLIPLVQVTPRGVWGRSGQAKWALTEQWFEGTEVEPVSIDEVVLRYLGAFGPASVADAQQWCGLTRLNEVIDRLRSQLVSFQGPNGRELFDVPDAPRPDPDTPAPPRFFPEYDNIFISHADRSRMAPADFQTQMTNAWLAMGRDDRTGAAGKKPLSWSMFSVDGSLSGTWKLERNKGEATLLLQPMIELSDDDLEAVAEEGRALGEFLAAGSRLRVELVS